MQCSSLNYQVRRANNNSSLSELLANGKSTSSSIDDDILISHLLLVNCFIVLLAEMKYIFAYKDIISFVGGLRLQLEKSISDSLEEVEEDLNFNTSNYRQDSLKCWYKCYIGRLICHEFKF
uniref:Uncharacterized protein n=1 Tax=Glossina pallidipes TaxID=7398 RepID=A0A1B0A7G4_GLOPL